MKKTLKMDDILDGLVGKTLHGFAFGWSSNKEKSKEDGVQYAPLPAKITRSWIGTTEGDKDPCIWFMLDDYEQTEVCAYDNEAFTISDGEIDEKENQTPIA